jgi:hypothetical protein
MSDYISDLIKSIDISGNRTKEERMIAQLDLPIGFAQDFKNKVTLREMIEGGIGHEYVPFKDLSSEQKAEITIDRINAQYKYQMFIGKKVLDKTSVAKELKDLTSYGKDLIDIEELTIEFVLKDKEGYIKCT